MREISTLNWSQSNNISCYKFNAGCFIAKLRCKAAEDKRVRLIPCNAIPYVHRCRYNQKHISIQNLCNIILLRNYITFSSFYVY